METEQNIDVHKSAKRLADFEQLIKKNAQTPSGKILLEYIRWHEIQLKNNKMTPSSALRSLHIAYDMCNAFFDIQNASAKQLEDWFIKETSRNVRRRTGGDTTVELNRTLTAGSIKKIERQVSKFLKFCDFLNYDKGIELFSVGWARPERAKFLHIDLNGKKRIEPPSITQQQVKELIEELKNSPNRNAQATAVLVAVANDCGARLSEILSLRNENIVPDGEFLRISFTQSKTTTRQNLLFLSKPLLLNWVSQTPNRHDKKGLVFCNKNGNELISYGELRKQLHEAIKKLNLTWKENSSFHFLRHLFASRSYDWAESLRNYWLGWQQKGMLATYGSFGVEMCKEPFMKMISKEKNPMMPKEYAMSVLHGAEKDALEQLVQAYEPMLKAFLQKNYGKAL